tara:strand:- start:1826 stop:2356 length:531 start_codon:yes stop_codon:yes gene_type:complete
LKVLFLDIDGVICLLGEYGSRIKRRKKAGVALDAPAGSLPLELRYDSFNNKAVKVLNQIIEGSGCEIVVSSDWRLYSSLEEMGELYESRGIIKKPIAFTSIVNEGRRQWERARISEILLYLEEHPEITKWVAVDDMELEIGKNVADTWNFVRTNEVEGIKQSGIKDKILGYLEETE